MGDGPIFHNNFNQVGTVIQAGTINGPMKFTNHQDASAALDRLIDSLRPLASSEPAWTDTIEQLETAREVLPAKPAEARRILERVQSLIPAGSEALTALAAVISAITA
ncbi:hypothetical protein [Glycomyces sp. YM15]|uniref:hypothetical protein n=1 Tax=Glycomyces sp. YM15 TaxID=2800446 RepID=UPI0019625D99|nr:hypothetical protein [Glycomyces sp. YM15]